MLRSESVSPDGLALFPFVLMNDAYKGIQILSVAGTMTVIVVKNYLKAVIINIGVEEKLVCSCRVQTFFHMSSWTSTSMPS